MVRSIGYHRMAGPFKSENMMRLRILSTNDTAQIHGAVLRILDEIGMDVRDEDTRKDLKAAGCREADTGYLLFPGELVEKSLKSIPKRFTLYDRNGGLAIDTADTVPHFGPGLNAITILDHRTGKHRECLLDDVREAARLCDRLPNMDMASGMGNPSDIASEKQALETVKTIIEETPKPMPFIAHNEIEDEEVWDYISEVAGGWEKLAEKPSALDLTGPYSPLELGEEACRRLRYTARKRLPVVCYPAMLPGTTGPVTLDGAIAQSSAEIVAGLVVHQLAEPGAPVLTASSILPMDLKTGSIAYGSPEYMLVGIGAVDYFGDLGVPTWIGAGCTDSHILDTQAAAEAGMSIYQAMSAGTSFIHNLGFMSAGKSGALEMLVLTDEIAGGAKRFYRGISVTEESLGIEVTRRAYRDHSFMMDDHTLDNMRTAMWEPVMLQRNTLETWAASGSEPLEKRIRERVRDLLI
jgi:trimethylamine---corrinoid protein Co-methyltransferase